MNIQVTYGAVMLSFLGALHWGMEFAGYGGHQGWKRLTLGAAPVLYAWPTLALEPTTALIAQWVGFTGLWYADLQATNAGWSKTCANNPLGRYSHDSQPPSGIPSIDSTSRSSSAPGKSFGTDSTRSATNASLASIIGSLAGTSYWGPAPGHGLLTAELTAIREERDKAHFENSGKVQFIDPVCSDRPVNSYL